MHVLQSTRRHQRGSAMTELLLCLLPYCLLLLGIILIGQLSIGKQETFMAVGWTGPRPEQQEMDGQVDQHFFMGPGEAVFEEELPYTPDVKSDEEEPVLPYEKPDIVAAVSRESVHVGHTTRVEDGEVVVDINVQKTKEGQAMLEAGLVQDFAGILGKQTYDPDDIKNLSFNFPVDEDRCQEVADTLSSWLSFSRSHAGYKYQLGGKPLALEARKSEDLEGALAFREEFEMGGKDDEVYALECASPNPDGFKGFHADMTVDIDKIVDMNYRDHDSQDGEPVVDPPSLPRDFKFVIDSPALEKAWNPNFTP